MKSVRVAAAQTLEYRNDMDAALTCVDNVTRLAELKGARLVCFPEGFLQGYLTDAESARRVALDLSSPKFEAVLRQFPMRGPVLVLGIIEVEDERLFNTALVIERGIVVGRYRKMYLLDGESAFEAGVDTPLFEVDGLQFGINICHDTNFPEAARKIAELGATMIVCPANNMMRREKAEVFRDLHNAARGERCRETGLWLLSADVTGEREGRVAWGPTAVLSPEGRVLAQLPLGEPGLLVFDIPVPQTARGRA